jgi:pimeloyl-ACP methyl ester carboxylesterase
MASTTELATELMRAKALAEHAPGCTERRVTVRGETVYYLDTGEPTATPVLYLHGLFGSRFEWCVLCVVPRLPEGVRPWVDASQPYVQLTHRCRAAPSLAADGQLRLLCPDLRGFGHSTAATGAVECTVAQVRRREVEVEGWCRSHLLTRPC